MDLDKWTIDILDELIAHPEIEGETFDFKERRMGNMAQDICAMANTRGGVLVLGIGQNEIDGKLLGFLKNGWEMGEEDNVNKTLANHVYSIEPVPKLRTRPLYDTDGKFYMLVKVEPIVKDRPYVIKGKGQCFLRVGNGSPAATRSAVLNLCKQTIDRTTNVDVLKTTAEMLKQQLQQINKNADKIGISGASMTFLPEVAWEPFSEAAKVCMWLIHENDLIEPNLVAGPFRKHGFFTMIYSLQEVNIAIKRYNLGDTQGDLRSRQFGAFYTGYWQGNHFQFVIKYLDEVILAARKFLSDQS